jgi:serine/threonine protein kinase
LAKQKKKIEFIENSTSNEEADEDFVVIKKIYCDDIDKINSLTSEVNNIIQLNHKNVIKYLDSYVELIEDISNYNSISYFCIVMPFSKIGDLKNYIKKKKNNIKEKKYIDFFLQISEGIKYLHENDIIHRDLKPENIFLFKDENDKHILKIGKKNIFINYKNKGDFGLSIKSTYSIYKTICGTLKNAAPEQFYVN